MKEPQEPCFKKTMDREHAMQAAARGRTKDRPATAYRCLVCGGWHVGTSNKLKRPTKTLYTNHQLGGTHV